MEKRNLIILCNPKFSPNYKIPYSLLAISRILDKEGFEIKIIDGNIDKNYIKKIKKYSDEALILGITSLTGLQIRDGLRVSKLVKEINPSIKVVWGGWHPTLLPIQTIKNPYIDIVVRGQGEITFTELVHAIARNSKLKNILGITYKKNGKIVNTPNRPLIDINKLPPYPFHLLNLKKYVRRLYGFKSINYISSYGCPYRCGFCSVQTVYKKMYCGLTPERMINDMELLINECNIEYITIEDSNFFANFKRVKDFCSKLTKRKLNIKWSAAIRANYFRWNNNFWKLAKKSGAFLFGIGAETGSPRMLKLLKKDITLEDIIYSAKKAIHYDFFAEYSFIIGLPLETKKDYEMTIEFIDKILSMSDKLSVMVFLYTPYPGTPLYPLALKLGFKPPKSLEGWANFTLNNINVPWINEKKKRLVNQLNFYIIPHMKYLKHVVPKSSKSRKLLYSLLYHIAKLRWERKFFSLPIDYKLLQIYEKFKKL